MASQRSGTFAKMAPFHNNCSSSFGITSHRFRVVFVLFGVVGCEELLLPALSFLLCRGLHAPRREFETLPCHDSW